MSDTRVQHTDEANPWADRPGGLPPMAGGEVQPGEAPAGAPPEGGGQGAGEADPHGLSGLRPQLDGLAPGVKEQVNQVLSQYDGNVTKKFQEHADYRKTWEPFEAYKDLGITDFEPEYLGELMQLADVFEDDSPGGQLDQWLTQHAEQRGLLKQGRQAGGDGGGDGEGDEFDLPETREEFDQMLEAKLQERLQPIEQQISGQTEAQQTQQMQEQADTALDKLLKADDLELDDESRDDVFTFAMRYANEPGDMAQTVAKGYADYKRITGQAEKGVVESRAGRGRGPEGGGGAPPMDPAGRPKTIEQASQMARERARQQFVNQ